MGISAAAYGMAISGRRDVIIILGVTAVLIAVMMLVQIWRVVGHHRRRSVIVLEDKQNAERHYVEVLRQINTFVEARYSYSDGHSKRVGRMAQRIGKEIGLGPRQCRMLNLAGELHDIGLLAIPDGILNKHVSLGAEEFSTVKKHSEVSYQLLKPLTSLRAILPAVRHHHERMNGTGYPAGIAGQQIPLEARILAVADAYDAMTHDRPHRAAMTPLAAMGELKRCSPHGFDAQCVQALAMVVHLPALERTASLAGNPVVAD